METYDTTQKDATHDFSGRTDRRGRLSVRLCERKGGRSYKVNASNGSPSGRAANLRVFKSCPTCSKVKSRLSVSWYPYGYFSMVKGETEMHPKVEQEAATQIDAQSPRGPRGGSNRSNTLCQEQLPASQPASQVARHFTPCHQCHLTWDLRLESA